MKIGDCRWTKNNAHVRRGQPCARAVADEAEFPPAQIKKEAPLSAPSAMQLGPSRQSGGGRNPPLLKPARKKTHLNPKAQEGMHCPTSSSDLPSFVHSQLATR
jgi:hypothetical protein